MMLWKVLGTALLLLAVAVVLAGWWGERRWSAQTGELSVRLARAAGPLSGRIDEAQWADLPAPVRRYFQAVLPQASPLIERVRLRQTGTFNMNVAEPRWVDFTATQSITTARPGFLWDARMRLVPGLAVHVRDAYVDGEGILEAHVLGLFPVVSQRGTPALAQGELMRYLAEAVWYPTALLPGQGVHWEAIDARHARATLADGDTAVSLVFEFDDQGFVAAVRADARYREAGGELVATPWRGTFGDYVGHDGGVQVPQRAQVAWKLDGEWVPYWRGRLVSVDYEWAR